MRVLILAAAAALLVASAAQLGSAAPPTCGNDHRPPCGSGAPERVGRLVTSGAEIRDPQTADSTFPDGQLLSATNITFDTTNMRSGSACWKVAPTTSTPAYVQFATAIAAGVTGYARAYVMFAAQADVPASSTAVLRFLNGTTNLRSITIGTVSSTGVTFSDGTVESAEVPYGTYARLEMSLNMSASGGLDDVWTMLLDGTQWAGSTANLGTLPITNVRFGFISTPGTSKIMYVDDVAVNDSQGANQNTYPGSGKVVLLKPISLNTNGGSWTDSAAATTSAALADAIDNTPPTGIADTTASAGHQVRNAAANTSLDMNLTTYTTAGIASTDTINVLQPMVNVAAPVVTAAKTGSFGIVSNPAITNRVFTGGATSAANFWRGAAAGTYPTNWGWEVGTTTYGSSVTVGTSPVARVTITGGTAARIAMVDFMGLYVDYTPAAADLSPIAGLFDRQTSRRRTLQRM